MFRARVVYSYMPANDDELAIQENDVVNVLRLVITSLADSLCVFQSYFL